jgi:hypothetical protein
MLYKLYLNLTTRKVHLLQPFKFRFNGSLIGGLFAVGGLATCPGLLDGTEEAVQ